MLNTCNVCYFSSMKSYKDAQYERYNTWSNITSLMAGWFSTWTEPSKTIQTFVFSLLSHITAQCIKWPTGLRHSDRIGRFPVQTSLVAWSDQGTQPCYQTPCDLCIKNWGWELTDEWGCPHDNGPKLARGQPNSR